MPRPLEGPKPRLVAPDGAVDTHIHFYYPPYGPQPGGPPPPEEATIEHYQKVQSRLGVYRAVVVQANVHQLDNSCILDAVRRMGLDNARAVVAVTPDVSDADLEAMTAQGARGARIMELPGGAVGMDQALAVAERVKPFDWHVIVQFDGRDFESHMPVLEKLPGPFILDHIGKFLEPVATDSAAFTAMLRLLDRGDVYVKLSAPYETSKSGAPDYADTGALAKRLAEHAPDRMLWASNWPHFSVTGERWPDDARMLDLLLDWAPDPALQKKILVDNPNRLYGFDA